MGQLPRGYSQEGRVLVAGLTDLDLNAVRSGTKSGYERSHSEITAGRAGHTTANAGSSQRAPFQGREWCQGSPQNRHAAVPPNCRLSVVIILPPVSGRSASPGA
jgi:hypothetical protein